MEPEEATKEPANPGDALFAFPGSPTKDQVEVWKQEHGEVFCSGFSMDELFVFRPLKRHEFVELQVLVAQAQGQVSQFEIEETTVKKCLLWTTPNGSRALETKAGTCSTLHEQVLQNSNFVNASMASVLVVKL